MTEREALVALQAENARLAALLESHGIAWRTRPAAASPPALTASVQEPAPVAPGTSLSTAEKLALFRRLFRGRTDIYPVRREGKTSGKSGLRQRVAVRCLREAAHQCDDCSHRLLVPLSDSVIYDHLAASKRSASIHAVLQRAWRPTGAGSLAIWQALAKRIER